LTKHYNPYERLGLLANPFPRIPIPAEENNVLVDVDGKFSLLKRLMEQTSISGNSMAISLIGPYGSGKTHYLKALCREARKFERTLAIYVDNPGTDFFTIYKKTLEEIGIDTLITVGLKQVKEALRLMSINPELGYSWLLGEKLTYKERNKFNVRKNLDQEEAINILAETLKHIFTKYGRITVLLIDELETILDLNIIRKQRYLSSLRKFIDKTQYGLFMVIACTPAGWDTIVSNHPSLVRRVSRTIYLENATFSEMKLIVKEYLRRYLISDNDEEDIIADDVLKQVLEVTDGNIGETLRLLSIIVDEAAFEGLSEINVEFVKRVLSENV